MELFNKSNENKDSKNFNISREKTDLIIKKMKERTKIGTIKINENESTDLSIFDSKFGGLPYWDGSIEYPTDSNGDQLIMLAQINFEDENLKDERLPESGILQFFISTDDLMGADFDNLTGQKGSRVIYHKSINKSITEDDVRAKGILSNVDLDDTNDKFFPFYKQYKITFEKTEDYITSATQNFETIVKETIKELFNKDIDGNVWEVFSNDEYDYLCEAFYSCGHKMLGYPFFTQWDPREEDYSYKGKKYEILLLQIDSVDDIIWGDSGVGNFFINEQDLINRNFSDVMYTWDCY